MRIITLWQPWASLIALQLKGDETRSWATPYRGALGIHAAKRKIYKEECSAILENCPLNKDKHRLWEALCNISANPSYGCVVAVSQLTDCRMMAQRGSILLEECHSLIDDQSPLERAVGDWQVGRYAWRLENVISLPQPILHKGTQGMRNAPDELKHRIEEALARV